VREARRNLPSCKGAAVSIKWLTDPEPDSAAESCILASDYTATTPALNIPAIEEALRAPEFSASPDKCQYLIDYFKLSREDISEIAKATCGQTSVLLWSVLHTHCLTASNFAFAIRASTGNRSCASLLKAIAGRSHFKRNPNRKAKTESDRAVEWGSLNEVTAFNLYKTNHPEKKVEPTSLWLHPSGVLGASPDGLVDEDGILEIKCPYSMRNVENIIGHLTEDLIPVAKKRKVKSVLCISFNEDGTVSVDFDHDHWHQIQGQLFCTSREVCYYGIWTSHDCICIPILKDPGWEETNGPLIFKTYFERYVPHALRNL